MDDPAASLEALMHHNFSRPSSAFPFDVEHQNIAKLDVPLETDEMDMVCFGPDVVIVAIMFVISLMICTIVTCFSLQVYYRTKNRELRKYIQTISKFTLQESRIQRNTVNNTIRNSVSTSAGPSIETTTSTGTMNAPQGKQQGSRLSLVISRTPRSSQIYIARNSQLNTSSMTSEGLSSMKHPNSPSRSSTQKKRRKSKKSSRSKSTSENSFIVDMSGYQGKQSTQGEPCMAEMTSIYSTSSLQQQQLHSPNMAPYNMPLSTIIDVGSPTKDSTRSTKRKKRRKKKRKSQKYLKSHSCPKPSSRSTSSSETDYINSMANLMVLTKSNIPSEPEMGNQRLPRSKPEQPSLWE